MSEYQAAIPGERRICNLLFSAAAIAVVAGGAQATDPHFTLVNQQSGLNAITVPIEGYTGQHDLMSGGVTVGDFNTDGWPDLYIPGLGSGPDMLFINQQDGTFVDEAAQWGVDRLHMANGSAVGDVNNDGLPDLYVISFGPADEPAQPGKCLLYINQGSDADGQWSFREEAEIRGVNHIMGIPAGKGAAFGDMDLDGDLDLYAATWEYSPENDGNRLFENDGNGFFSDVTDEMIPDSGLVLRGFTPKFVDVTGDRYPDLLLTCDFATSRLYINNGPGDDGRISYRDETVAAGITADNNGMGATVNDFNGDGRLDWFMTNIFVPSANYYNTLYLGISVDEAGTPTFLDQAVARGVENNGWGWGVVSGDYNNDGDVDLVATNGWPGWPNEPTRFWSNNGSGNFSDIAFTAGLKFNIAGRGLVHLDYDRDGDLDLVFIDSFGPVRIYRNDLEPREFSRYLRIDINTDSHPCLAPMGYGTRIIATYNGAEHLRVIDGASSYLGQSELTVHFGLELTEIVDEIRFEWADGSVTTMQDVAADQQLDLHAFHALDLNSDGAINFFDISVLLRAYISGDAQADINADGSINATDITDFLSGYDNPCQ